MKQTAVEFLESHLIEYGFDLSLHKIEIQQAKEMEKQKQDEFSVEFAEWCIKWRVEFFDSSSIGILYKYGGMNQTYTIEKLLEIFKNK